MMIKNCLLAVSLLSLAVAGGCAKGGNSAGSGITVTVSDGNLAVVYATQTVQFNAAVTGTTNMAVTWSLSGTACTGTPNPCGTIDPTTGVYHAPATAPNPSAVTFTAASHADSTAIGSLGVKLVQVKVIVTPTPVTVGTGLVQQFTAVAVPDSAPQTFTWACTPTSSCGSLVQDSTTSGLAVYTAPSSPQNGVAVTATSTVAQVPVSAGVGTAKVTVASSRLPSGTYAFRFSGYENGNPVTVAGSLTVAANGSITGVEDVLVAGVPPQTDIAITSGSYSPSSNNNNSNNLGTLTLNLAGGATNTYTAVLTSSGIIRMIESDSTGRTGSGVMQKSANTIFNSGPQTFVFGFTGVDSTGNRVGYVGMLPMTPGGTGGTITGGLLDSNDNGNTTNVCGAPPCAVAGNYSADPTIAGLWHLTLTSGTTLNFDFFVSGGQTTNATASNPLTLYAISTDPTVLSGSMVYQFPMTYNNAAFCPAATSQCTSVSNLTGASANVSLTFATTDGTSNGTGGTGGFTGNFDQNNNGTILSVSSFAYTYVATGGANGRYTFQMLGNPNASQVVAPLPFVLYASGANRGFLLDQSSPSVMTGTMDPQPSKSSYTPTELPGTFAAATIGNSDPTLVPVVQNLLFTSPGGSVFNVTGTQNPNNQALTGTYTMTVTGTGTITLTAPPPPSVATNAIYAIGFDVTNSSITDFMMIGTTSGAKSSIIFAQE